MSYLIKKMVRSIKQFKFQFISVLLLAALSVTVYSGLEGIWRGIEYEFDYFTNETNLADEWVFAAYFTEDDISAISKTKGVSDISETLRIQATTTAADGKESNISLDTVGNENISSMYLMEGEAFSRDLKNSIWIDAEYAKINAIKPGDRMPLCYNNHETEVTVRGIILSSERTHFVGSSDYYVPDHIRFGYGYMSDDVVSALGIKISRNLLKIKSSGSDLEKNINNILGSRFLAYYNRDTMFEVSFVSNQAGNLKRISNLFSGLFILLAILSMHTTIKRLVDAQSQDIATLKSLGLSNRSLILHYSMYGLSVSLIGTILGYICSFPFSYALQTNQKMIITIPEWPVKHTFGSLAVILLIVILSVATSVLAVRKNLKGLPAEFKRNHTKHGKKLFLEKFTNIWTKLGFGMNWTLRDAAAHKTRIFLGIVSICGSFMLLMIGFGMPDSIGSFTEKTYSRDFTYSYKLALNTSASFEELSALKQELNGQLTETVQSRARFNGDDNVYFKTVTIFSDGEYINLKTIENEKLDSTGAYITEGMADASKIKKGDSVELFPSFGDKPIEFKIAGIIPLSMPQGIYLNEKCWTEAGAAFMPSHMLTGNIPNTDVLDSDPRVSQVISRYEHESNLASFRTAFTGIFNLMKLIAFVLVVIVLYNLSILSFIERTKEYNTFRVLGFHYNEIRKLASFENIIILFFGTITGLPLGLKFLELYCANFSNDTLKIYAAINGTNLAFICVIVFLCTILTTLLLSLKISRIDMVQALKE